LTGDPLPARELTIRAKRRFRWARRAETAPQQTNAFSGCSFSRPAKKMPSSGQFHEKLQRYQAESARFRKVPTSRRGFDRLRQRSEAGLTDIGQFCAPHTVVVLLEVNDISRAKAFLAPSLSRAKALLAPRAKAFGHSDGLPAG
jgi:hypothetical protein